MIHSYLALTRALVGHILCPGMSLPSQNPVPRKLLTSWDKYSGGPTRLGMEYMSYKERLRELNSVDLQLIGRDSNGSS